jgi:hypothetical protein
METRKLEFDEYDCYELSFVQGEKFSYTIPDGTVDFAALRDKAASFPIHVEGEVEVTYERYPGAAMRRVPMTTALSYPWTYPDPGTVTMEVMTPTYRYYCVKDKRNRSIHFEELRVASGASATIPAGKNVFVVGGELTVAGQLMQAPFQVLTDVDTTVSASSDCFGVVMPRAAP